MSVIVSEPVTSHMSVASSVSVFPVKSKYSQVGHMLRLELPQFSPTPYEADKISYTNDTDIVWV